MILYTSGTTAKPKGVMLNEDQFDENCTGFLEHLHITSEDSAIVALPLFHSFGNIMALVFCRVGATLIPSRRTMQPFYLSSLQFILSSLTFVHVAAMTFLLYTLVSLGVLLYPKCFFKK